MEFVAKLPSFTSIEVSEINEKLSSVITENKKALHNQLENIVDLDWECLIEPIEEREDTLNKFWSPISHLNSVCSSSDLREEHDKAREKLSEYYTEFGQNEELYLAYRSLKESSKFERLDTAQKSMLVHALRDFELSGIGLSEDKRSRFSEIKMQLSKLSSEFSNNVLDATEAWSFSTENLEDLSGIPDVFVKAAENVAIEKGRQGYTLTLDGPIYMAVMSQADNSDLREKFYKAYCTRASDQGPNAGKWNNGPLIEDILSLKQELAKLLGKAHYAELSLVTKMADEVSEVEDFLRNLAEKASVSAKKDLNELENFARKNDAVETLKPWDIAYFSEKLKHENYEVSQEELRQYFTLPKVLKGLFEVAETLFSIDIVEAKAPDLWHESAKYFEIKKDGKQIAGFYTDLYTREGKRGGAWMDVCLTRRKSGNTVQLPVAYLVCNFNPPVGEQAALLTHNDVTTLFHEFGHGLHHMLTKMQVAGVSGINGVEWDAVELPSQFLENWAWQPEVLKSISSHVETGEPIPDDLIEKMIAAKNFQSGLFLLRQIEFGLFDILIHRDYGEEGFIGVQETLDKVRKEIAVILPPKYNRFQNGFSHIFSGGYSAGYYSYLWAEVLSADAFSAFEEHGIFSKELGEAFENEILSCGASKPASELFKSFRGRSPDLSALLRHCGIE